MTYTRKDVIGDATQTFLGGKVVLHSGDCREVLASLPEASVDSIVTDPPYALTAASRNGSPRNNDPETPFGRTKLGERGFMGKTWDVGDTAFAVEFWQLALRCLKPGGHIVAFGGTRTYHRMACAIEDAGFEIRDQIGWCYGSGFPKSHNLDGDHEGWGTALKPAWESVCVARKPSEFWSEYAIIGSQIESLEACLWSMLPASTAEKNFGLSRSAFDAVCASAPWSAEELLNTRVALSEAMGTSRFVLALTSSLSTVSSWKNAWAEGLRPENTSITETALSTTTGLRTLKFSLSKITPASITLAHKSALWSIADASTAERVFSATVAALSGTLESHALAHVIAQLADDSLDVGATPNWQSIVLARKPLIGTVAANVQKHGTGALNIDGCRIEAEKWRQSGSIAGTGVLVNALAGGLNNSGRSGSHDLGRWPANLCHDGSEEVMACFPDAPGQLRATGPEFERKAEVYGKFAGVTAHEPRNDSGSAARFFFTAKADSHDRIASKHPTVKPLDLMQWLVRLVTPKRVLSCPQCHPWSHSNDSAKEAGSAESVRGMWNCVPPEGQLTHGALLQSAMCVEGARAEAGSVREMRDGVPASEGWGSEVLQQVLRGETHCSKQEEQEAVSSQQEGIQADLDAAASELESTGRVCVRASTRNGNDTRKTFASGGGRASHKPQKNGQPSGEPSIDVEGGARQTKPATAKHSRVPPLQGEDCDKPSCPHCGHRLEWRPGTCLDPFAGTGTTGEAAWREGFRAILIEREAEYQADIARRMDLAEKPSKRAAVAKTKGKIDDHGPLFSTEAAQ